MANDRLLLSATGIDVDYGASRALTAVDVHVPAGRALAIVGANGAGKSSLGRALCGLVKPRAGSILFDGKQIAGKAPYDIRRLGLAYLPEGRGIFPTLSVQDNLKMAVRWLPSRDIRRDAIDRALDFAPLLTKRRNQLAGTLSGGEQQILALGCELSTVPRLLIVDEVSLGLAPMIVDRVFERLEHALKEGVAIILIEQFIHRALAFANEITVLRRGSVAFSGRTSAVDQDELLSRYLGDQFEAQNS